MGMAVQSGCADHGCGGVSHKDANRAAALIMMQMFECDITTNQHFIWGKSPQQAYFEARVASERSEAQP
jgi:hypothetical protein